MTIDVSRSKSMRRNPSRFGPYITLLRTALPVLAVAVTLCGNSRASASESQDRGFPAAGTTASNYDQIKQELVSTLAGCGSAPSNPDFVAPKITKFPRNPGEFYPDVARVQGEQAVIMVSLLVDSLGNVRFLHVLQAFPTQPDPALVAAAMQLVRGYAVTPAWLNGEPISYWTAVPVRFILQDAGGPMGSLLRQKAWLAMLDKANAGDVQSIVNSAYVAELVGGETGLSREGELSLIIDSALHGADYARMDLYRMLSVCSRASVVEPWVSADAKAGSLQAEMTLAQITWARMLARNSEASQAETLSGLLHNVADGTDPFFRLWAAGVLATEPG